MTLSWLSFVPDMLSHLALLSWSLGNWWKEAFVFWLGLLSQLVMYVQEYCVVLDLTDSHSSHTIVNIQVSCLTPWSLKLGNRYSCSHSRVSKRPPADLAIPLHTLRAAKRATGCTVMHSMHTFACVQLVYLNWRCMVQQVTPSSASSLLDVY